MCLTFNKSTHIVTLRTKKKRVGGPPFWLRNIVNSWLDNTLVSLETDQEGLVRGLVKWECLNILEAGAELLYYDS